MKMIEVRLVGDEAFVERAEHSLIGCELQLGLPLEQLFRVADVFEVDEDGCAGVVLVFRVAGGVVPVRHGRRYRLAAASDLGVDFAFGGADFAADVTLSFPLYPSRRADPSAALTILF